jgi:hypothetical protein
MNGIRLINDVNIKKGIKSKKLIMKMSKKLKAEDKLNDNHFFVERE